MKRAAVVPMLALLASLSAAERGEGAAPSPRLLAGMTPAAREEALRRFRATADRLRATGVDRIYPQFALDLAKYPRGGVAHRNLLVVLCKFPAEGSAPAQGPSSVSTPSYFYRHFFSDDPTDGLISLREYYRANSRGRLVISGHATTWLEMPHSYDYYANGEAGLGFGNYPRSSQRLAEDAMAAAYQHFGGNLAYFDNDGPDGIPSSGDDDGYIDAVTVIVPGVGAELVCGDQGNCDRLWAHESGIATYSPCPGTSSGPGCLPGMTLGSVRGFIYSLGSEYNTFPGDNASGTWFHEFSHTLGLPDLYDLFGGTGAGFFSLMAFGNYLPYDSDPNTAGGPLGSRAGNLDAWCRQYLGFDDPTAPTVEGLYTLPPVSRQGGSLRVWSNGEPGTEYFLLENRLKEGSDQFLPGEGILVYHVDDTKIDNLSGYPNYRVSVVQADSLNPLEMENCFNCYGDPEDFFPGTLLKRSLTESTQPSSRAKSGTDTGIRIWNIAGAADGADTASLNLRIARQTELRLAGYTTDDGGGDNYADPNESIQLAVTMRNVGLQSAIVRLTLSTTDPAVTIGQALVIGGTVAPGATLTFSPFVFDIGSIATLPHDIPFTIDWTEDGGGAGSVDFPLTVGMAAGLSEGFEPAGGEPGIFWTTAALSGTGADQWHASTTRARGAQSAKLGSTLPLGGGSNEAQTYADLQDAVLVSPAFGLPSNSELVFYSYIEAETFGGAECFDGGRVEISIDGGEWVPLAVDGGYGNLIKFDSEATLRGAEVFSGSPRQWRRVTANLSGYSGSARIRFRFSSDFGNAPFVGSSQARVYEGWYVDDVLIQPRTSTGPTPRRLSLRGGPSPYNIGGPSAGSIVLRFSAPDGLPHPELSPEVRVYDVAGRLVRALRASPNGLVPSEFRAVWNARDSRGETCRSGIYFAQVDIQGKSESFRLVLVR